MCPLLFKQHDAIEGCFSEGTQVHEEYVMGLQCVLWCMFVTLMGCCSYPWSHIHLTQDSLLGVDSQSVRPLGLAQSTGMDLSKQSTMFCVMSWHVTVRLLHTFVASLVLAAALRRIGCARGLCGVWNG